jgi:hypothetical protein
MNLSGRLIGNSQLSAENLAAIATFRQSKARRRQEIIVFCFAAHVAPNWSCQRF